MSDHSDGNAWVFPGLLLLIGIFFGKNILNFGLSFVSPKPISDSSEYQQLRDTCLSVGGSVDRSKITSYESLSNVCTCSTNMIFQGMQNMTPEQRSTSGLGMAFGVMDKNIVKIQYEAKERCGRYVK